MGFVLPVVRAEKRARTTGYCPSRLRRGKRPKLTARPLEPEATYTYMSEWAQHHALVAIRTDNGQMRNAVEGQFPIGINEFNPTNDNLILWDIHGDWEVVHRPWVINTQDGKVRPVMLTIKGEGSGHQFWSWNGQRYQSGLQREVE